MPDQNLSLFASLRDAYEASRRVLTPADLGAVLGRIAEIISEQLGWGVVAINVHRRAWDDFETLVVHGPQEAREVLLGTTQTWTQWAPLMNSRYERRGAYFVPQEAGVAGDMAFYVQDADGSPGADDWRPQDVLLVLMRGGDGEVAGVLCVDAPRGGRRPSDAEIDVLVSVAEAAGAALQQARESASGAAHQSALRHLLGVSARIAEARSATDVLDAVCRGIRDALGFQRVAIELADQHGSLRAAAHIGWAVAPEISFSAERMERLLRPEFEEQGCYIVDHVDALRELELNESPYRSQLNGRGPWAWHRHWLMMPLRAPDGAIQGFIWVDDPADHLLPDVPRLQALRLFADQAQAALEAARHYEETRVLAEHDPLTGLPNRRVLLERIRQALDRARHRDRTIGVLFLDIDRFKSVNDTHGHDVGDEVLRAVASRIDRSLRPGDTVARLGGDEFVVLCGDVRGQRDALEVAERIRERVAEPIAAGSLSLTLSASVGVALPLHGDEDAAALVHYADVAMYRAKGAGRDALEVASADLRAGASARAQLERALGGALERGELSLAYQPIYCTVADRPVRVEALMRWDHPRLGRVPPLEFIPLAEDNGSIAELGRWALGEACEQWARWRAVLGSDAPSVAVNLSPRQLRDSGLRDFVAALVIEHRMPRGALTVEITEGALLEASPTAIHTLAGLREVGCDIELDDFGTGFSSLSSLADFNVDGIKIDRRFVSGGLQGRDAAIAEAVLAMARALELRVTAEGVETAEQLAWLRARACPQAQGFLFSRPLAAADATELLLRPEQASRRPSAAGASAR